MTSRPLAEWLAWQETLHPTAIDLGLERVAAVARRLDLLRPAPIVVSVAGTNGKGSTVAMLESILRAAGHCVGAYTSPHLVRYNERIRIDGREADDESICGAFDRIDAARGDISLTYFEFGTLAALDLFRRASLDVALIEVGMGGRLDAVNIVDADVAIVTSIGLDHQQWLGDDREAIGREKAGIFRAGRPAVCADPDPPATLVAKAREVGAPLFRFGHEFHAIPRTDGRWEWRCGDVHCRNLPPPALRGGFQYANAAAALMAVHLLADRLPVAPADIDSGLAGVRLSGRFQRLAGNPEIIVDVAHNPDSAAALASLLAEHPVAGRTYAVFAALGDKDLEGIAAPLAGCFAAWHVAGLPGVTRAQEAATQAGRLARFVRSPITPHADVAAALAAARSEARSADRIVVFGSFHTVGAALIAV